MRAVAKHSSASTPKLKPSDQLELYRRIFAESVDGIAIIDANGYYLEQNRAHELLSGYSDSDLEGQTPAIHLGPECFQSIAATLQRDGRFRGEVLSRTRDGGLLYLDLSAFSVVNEAGQVVCFVGIKRDITGRRKSEEDRIARIRELESVYALTRVLNQAPCLDDIYRAAIEAVMSALDIDRASILIFDDDGVMRFKAWHGLSDSYRAAVEGHSPWSRETRDPVPVTVNDVLLDPDLKPFADTIVSEGIRALGFVPIVYEDRLLGKFMLYFNEPHHFTETELRVAQALAAPVAFALERRRADEALRRSEQLAAAGRLAASIAHEINNPLAAITNLVYLLRTRPSDSVTEKYLADLDAELTRVSQITRQTLGFYRDTAGPTNVDLCALIADTLAVFTPRMKNKGITSSSDCAPATVFASSGELRQIFSNIISNAIDALEPSGSLSITSRSIDDRIDLIFADTGHGIAPEHLVRIFDPFFTTRKNGGTGLGLWITRQLVEKNGGNIKVETSTGPEDHGTRIVVSFPRTA